MSLFPYDPYQTASLINRLKKMISGPKGQALSSGLRRNLPYVSGPLKYSGRMAGASPKQQNSGFASGVGFAADRSVSSIASLLSQRNQQNQQPQQIQDPLMSLYEQLINQLQEPVNMPTGIDTENLMEQVRAAIDPLYDQRANEAESRTSRARKDVEAMYAALAEDYKELAPQQIEQANAAQEQIEDLYGELRSNIEGSYSRIASEQADLFQDLGIEAALPEVLDEQDDVTTGALTAASELETVNKQRYMDMGQIDSTYYREGAPLASMAGTNFSKDLLFELNEYLNQLGAERTSGIQSAYTDQLGQAQNALANQQQNAMGENARRQGMLWDMLQAQLQAQSQQSQVQLNPDTFMQQLPPNIQQNVASAFTRLQRSPEAVYGKVQDPRNPVPGTFVETTPEWYLKQADEMLRRGEIDVTTHQALLMYIQLAQGLSGR